MKSLPSLPQPAAILSFDFDGTLHDPAEEPPVPPEFFALIRELRDQQGIAWGINTGRSLEQLTEGFIESRFPFLPDWVVAREREIFFANPSGHWLPHAPWNDHCATEVHRLFKHSRHLLDRIRREVEDHTGAYWLEMDGEPAGFIARTVEEMAWIVDHITPLAAAEPCLAWQRNTIYLRFGHRDFHKGSSLSEIARLHHLTAQRCFAMGDGHNDLEMLDGAHARMTACPANAVDVIQDKIITCGGLITRARHGAGAVEALRHYFPA
jgi:HAD superfamily hydrolase (TIGR01484 family)